MSAPAAAAASDPTKIANKGLITASIMVAALMQSVDTTIANVALPHIQGSLSASLDQIVWVLTAYIVAAAMMTPVTAWLTERFGIKNVFVASVAGFTIASALCGAAQTLGQIVTFRFLQGLAGAALLPLTQAVLFAINPPEKWGQAMASFAIVFVAGPILGPVVGGLLTENYSWRWVFYVNLPFGALALFGLWTFLPSRPHPNPSKFDFLGFGALAVGVGALQLMLDRGQINDWFGSTETWIEMLVASCCAYVFLIHSLTSKRVLFNAALYRDRNFVGVTVAAFVIMGVLFAVLALLPPMLQSLYGYPVETVGYLSVPRGVGVCLTMFFVGRLVNKVDTRLLIGFGILLSAHSLWSMSHFTLSMGEWPFIWTGFEQGLASGFIFVPLSAAAFSTLPPALRVQGTTLYNFVRNIGSSIGISVIQTVFSQNIQRVHAGLAGHIREDNPAVRALVGDASLHSAAALMRLNAMVGRQAVMIAYINVFWVMAIAMVVLVPVLLLLKPPPRKATAPAVAAAEAHA